MPASASEDDSVGHKRFKEIESILRFRPDRLGHALLMPPELQPLLQRLQIPVECCPTSNVMTIGLSESAPASSLAKDPMVHGLKRHPQLGKWLQTNHPISISTDDSGVFGTNPTQELLLLQRSYDLPLSRIERITLDSIQHAFCDKQLKEQLTRDLTRRFQEIHQEQLQHKAATT